MDLKKLHKRFFAKVKKQRTGCWLWTGSRHMAGYGRINMGGTVQYAHRVSVLLSGREIPKGHHIDHLCRNPPCVNPDHLDVVTPKENFDRGIAVEKMLARRAASKQCKNGHAYSEANVYRWARKPEWRICRRCHADQRKRYRAAKRSRI